MNTSISAQKKASLIFMTLKYTFDVYNIDEKEKK